MYNKEEIQEIIASYKANSAFSVANEKKFTAALREILTESGYNDDCEMLIFGGPPNKVMKAVWSILSEMKPDKCSSILNDLFNSKRFKSNVSNSSVKRAMVLLYEILNSCTKVTDLSQMVYKKLMAMVLINSRTVDDFTTLLLNRINTQGFRFLLDINEQTGGHRKFNDLCKKACESRKSNLISQDIKDMIYTSVTGPNDNAPEGLGATEEKQEKQVVTETLPKSAQLKSIAEDIENLEKELSELRATVEIFKTEKAKSGEMLKKQNVQLNMLLMEKRNLEELNESLNLQVHTLQGQIQEYEIKIVDLNAEIEKHKKVLTVFNAEMENSQAELLNHLSSKLKVEYRDFLDACDVEMDIALGENMREQLRTVFRILERYGIKPGSR